MKKKVLRRAIAGLEPEDRLKITFLGEYADRSGTFDVIRTKKGRGKGGSQLVELKTADGEVFVTGTPQSDVILHVITPDGVLHGHETISDVPPTFDTNSSMAAALKESFKGLAERCRLLPKEDEKDTRSRFAPTETSPTRVAVASTHEPFNGTFRIKEIEYKRGRYGKILLTVLDDEGNDMVLDSFKHSGVITSFTIV